MNDKTLLLKIFLAITITCTAALSAIAQVKTKSSTTLPTKLPDDSLLATKVNLPYSLIVDPKLTAASTQAIYTPALVKAPVANVLNSLTGRLAGLFTLQSSGQPGADGVSLTLRGRTPLILIDGVPRTITNTDLEEIASVTVLKDAMATAMLGVRGANGAILITTKRGNANSQEISFSVQSAFQKPIGLPQPLGAYSYGLLRNEAINNELKVNPNFNTGLRYSDVDLAAFLNHTDPYGHPDINFQQLVLKPSAQLNRYALNIAGGSNVVRYYTTVEHLYQDGLLKTSNINSYNTNEYLSRYLIRSNIDININNKLTGGIHVLGSTTNENQPGATTASIFNSFLTTPNSAYPVYNPNNSYGGTPQFVNNIQGQAISSGYLQNYTRDLIADFYIKRTLNELTKGLYFKASAAYTSSLTESINRSKPVVAYQGFLTGGVQSYGAPLAVAATQLNTNAISTSTGVPGLGQYRQTYFEATLGWDRTFNDAHGFNLVVLANSDSKSDGANLAYTVQGLSSRGSYNYKQKYVVELAATYNGSNYYNTTSHYKYGFFPVAGLTWNIIREDFMQNLKWLNNLKLSATYGRTGNDNPGYFVYLQRIIAGPNASLPAAYFGTTAGANTTLAEQTLANPNITYEKANKLNVSLSGTAINDHLSFGVDYYNNRFSDLLIQRGQNTSLIGNLYPNENIGRNLYTGFDIQLGWQKPKNNGFSYYISLNAGLQQSKLLYANEVTQPYAYMQRTGQKVGQAFGYVAKGLYQDQADIDNSRQNGVAVVAGYTPQPGDIKYADQNGDGIINQFDQVPIGPKGPLIIYGADLGFTYRSFDVSFLFQGVANYNVNLSGASYFEFQNNGYGQAYVQQLGRFTPATAATATYPRLSIGNNPNNQAFSTYFFRPADYVRLKNLQIGYTIPFRYANAVKLKSIRVFATGVNLFTITRLKGGIDPENYNGLYPIQRLFNLGIKANL